MAFQFCERMIHDYRSLGFVIFRQVLPTSLLSDLRRATGRVHEIARQRSGPQAQRLQPIASYLNDAEMKPFRDYATLGPLIDAIHKVLTPRHTLSNGMCDRMGLLLEPASMPWCTAWHRDIREDAAGNGRAKTTLPDVEEFRRITTDPMWFNQINCPLYEDNCTWYVPGSYLRQFDLAGEIAVVERGMGVTDKATYEEHERLALEYCRAMPGAVRVSMDAGDFALYHPNGWHLGNYLPDRKRVTIHDWAPAPELVDWYERWGQARAAAEKKK